MRPHGPRDQSQAADQKNQHHNRVEQAGRLKINVEVRNNARKNEQGTRDRKQPSDDTAAIEEQQAHSEQHR